MQRVACFVAFVVALFGTAGPGAAQTAAGTIEVRVVDRLTHRPLENVQVTLLGPQAIVALTDRDGVVRFDDVPPATYSVGVRGRGYDDQRSTRFEVTGAERKRVTVELEHPLAEIGRVRSVPSVNADRTVDDRNPVRRVSDTLLDALGNLAGVSVDQSSLGGTSISLRNGDPGATALRINGLKVAGGISAAATNAGLFSGASVDFSPSSSNIDGAVNFLTAQPTTTWRVNADASYGSYARFDDHVTLTGTSGKLGLAITHGARGLESRLTGLRFQDASGLDYVHDGASRGDGNYVTFAYAASPKTTFKLSGMASANSGARSACASALTRLPCGDGPGSTFGYDYHFASASVQSQAGNLAFDAYAYTNDNITEYDQNGRLVALAPAGSSSDLRSTYDGGAVSATTTAGRHQLALSFSSARGKIAATQRSGAVQTATETRQIDDELELDDTYKLGARLKAAATLTHASVTDTGRATLASLKLTWDPHRTTTLEATVAAGSGSPQTLTQSTWSAPADASFDCSSGMTTLRAPSDRTGPQHAASATVSARHAWRTATVRLSAFNIVQYGAPITLPVPYAGEATVAPPPPGLLSAVAALWSQPTVCAAQPFDPSRLYAYTSLAGIGQHRSGATIDVRATIGSRATLIAAYTHAAVAVATADPRVTAPPSYIIPGRQLPQRPLDTGSVTLDVRATPAAEVLVNARTTGIGNANNQPSTTVAAIGIVATTAHGTITLLESNAFNARDGLFTTNRGFDPLPLAGGGSLALPTTPLAPRQFILRYAVSAGRRTQT